MGKILFLSRKNFYSLFKSWEINFCNRWNFVDFLYSIGQYSLCWSREGDIYCNINRNFCSSAFLVPYSTLIHHRNVIGYHPISTTINAVCFQWMTSGGVSAGAIIGFAIGAMYNTWCVDPPGGASALPKLISVPNNHTLGTNISIHR